MNVYRYRAIPLAGAQPSDAPLAGELAAESPAALRASLRRIGLQVIDARPARRAVPLRGAFERFAPEVRAALNRHQRGRRIARKAELFESLATMLGAGLPLLDAVTTLAGSRGPSRTMLVELRESLREGASLDEAMDGHPGWFDEAEVAMIRAGRASGELDRVLRSLAARHERAGQLSAKLTGALVYPSVVLAVGIGVVVFLSLKTLPDLVGILADAGVQPPRLTVALMAVGQWIARFGPLGALLSALVLGASITLVSRARRRGWVPPRRARALVPDFVRRARVARAWAGLSELARTGVPLTEALRITAPTVGGSLRTALERAAVAVEHGGELADSLDDPLWFDGEARRLVEIGQTAGELPEILARLAQRTQIGAARSIDRAAALLEPAVILLLASMIGVVVMAAVLPIITLQEVVA